jgi:hypothetical protein
VQHAALRFLHWADVHSHSGSDATREQSQQMPGNVLELDAMRQLLFNVRFHFANNVVSIRRSSGIAEGLLQFRQESGHLVSLPSDHYSIDLPKMPTTLVDRQTHEIAAVTVSPTHHRCDKNHFCHYVI